MHQGGGYWPAGVGAGQGNYGTPGAVGPWEESPYSGCLPGGPVAPISNALRFRNISPSAFFFLGGDREAAIALPGGSHKLAYVKQGPGSPGG